MRGIQIDHNIENFFPAIIALEEAIQFLESNPEVESPISQGATFAALKGTGKATDDILRNILTAVEDVGGRVHRLEQNATHPHPLDYSVFPDPIMRSGLMPESTRAGLRSIRRGGLMPGASFGMPPREYARDYPFEEASDR